MSDTDEYGSGKSILNEGGWWSFCKEVWSNVMGFGVLSGFSHQQLKLVIRMSTVDILEGGALLPLILYNLDVEVAPDNARTVLIVKLSRMGAGCHQCEKSEIRKH